MTFNRILTAVGLLPMLLAACGDGGSPEGSDTTQEAGPSMKILAGEAYYRERIALPPGAELTVLLEDVSRMDVPATVLAEYRVTVDTPPPYAFELEYDPSVIDGRMRYNVRAQIREGERLRFTSTTSNDPFRLPEGEKLRIMMSAAGGAGPR